MATDLEQYIRQAAISRGINPDIAVRVAKSEGGLRDPVKQSDVIKNGSREPSYGPFQLLIGGGNGFPTGMGNDALSRGIDPRTQEGALKGIDFALDTAKDRGWSPWYGAKAVGITGRMGIDGNPAAPMTTSSDVATRPPSPPQAPGTLAPLPSRTVIDHPIFGAMAPDAPPIADASPPPAQTSPLEILGQMALTAPPQPQPQPVQIRGPSPEQAQALTSFIEALRKRMA